MYIRIFLGQEQVLAIGCMNAADLYQNFGHLMYYPIHFQNKVENSLNKKSLIMNRIQSDEKAINNKV